MIFSNYICILFTFPSTALCEVSPGVFIGDLNLVQPTRGKAKGTVIILHGHGSTGTDTRFWMSQTHRGEIRFRHLRAMFPTGNVRKHKPGETNRTPIQEEQNAWYFKKEVELRADSLEENDSLTISIHGLSEIIKNELAIGIPINKIVIGGHTMGGIMALHMGLRFFPDMAGIFGLSTFLPRKSLVYEDMKKQNRTKWPKVYFSQGKELSDKEMPIANWTRETLDNLQKLGVEGQFHIIGDEGHSFSREQLRALWEWICTLLEK